MASNIKPDGQISAFNKGDLKLIKNALLPTQKGDSEPNDKIKKACVFPSIITLEQFAQEMGNDTTDLATILRQFKKCSSWGNMFFLKSAKYELTILD